MELLSVRTAKDTQVANVFVRRDKLVAFIQLIEQYRDKNTKKGKPKNQALIDSIAAVKLVAVRDLWQDSESAGYPRLDEAIWWEVWIRTAGIAPDAAFSRFAELARGVEMRMGEHYVAFPERVVLLARGTARQIGRSLDVLSYIAELREQRKCPRHTWGYRPASSKPSSRISCDGSFRRRWMRQPSAFWTLVSTVVIP